MTTTTAPKWIRISEAVKRTGVPQNVLLHELRKPGSGCQVRTMGERGSTYVRENELAAFAEREGLTCPSK